jgi:aminoglycoside 2'-N-acetyltransferase I
MHGRPQTITPRLRRVATDDLTDAEFASVRELLWAAFADVDGGMTEDDWAHGLGGVHVLLQLGGQIMGHASVVEREIQVDDRLLSTGYVEAVAVDPRHQRGGFGSRVMTEIGSYIDERFELGALATGTPRFYERLGWLRWTGPTFVRTSSGPLRTPDDDDGILVLVTSNSPAGLDRAAAISCEWRRGDVW